MYLIRQVDPLHTDNMEELALLHKATFANQAPNVDTSIGYWWLAFKGDTPIGFAGMTKSLRARKAGYLKRCGVLPAHRGHGLQRRLIRVREALARKLGWTTMLTDTCESPESSNSLIRAGYRLFDPKVPWGLVGSLYWRKKL